MSTPEKTTIPKVQRAWRVVRQGHPSKALKYVNDAPVRTDLADGEVLVKVGAAALNPVGYQFMRLMPNFVAKRPFAAAEYDLAGTVIISRSTLHAVGDRVYGWIDLPAQKTTKQGSLTEYTVVHGNLLHKRPDNMSAVDAAGIPLVAQTAWMGLFEIAKLQEGQTVFINGGSSSVGLFAIQLAKARGLTVWTSASGKNEELVRRVGADEFFDYTAMPLAQALAAHQPAPQFHAIFDAVGLYDPSLFNGMPKYTTPEAPYVTAGGPPEFTASGIAAVLRFMWAIALKPRFLGATNRKAHFFELTYKRDRADEVDKLVAAGKVRPVIDSTHELDDVLQAYERQMSKRARGKVIVSIDKNA